MIENIGPIWQAALGTLLTWSLTAAGSAMVFLFSGGQRKVLDASLGFAAGVMMAASYWSLLEPAIQMAADSDLYGEDGRYAFIPVGIGFVVGALFVCLTDSLLTKLGVCNPVMALSLQTTVKREEDQASSQVDVRLFSDSVTVANSDDNYASSSARWRGSGNTPRIKQASSLNGIMMTDNGESYQAETDRSVQVNWRRILLLIIAITVHNIPEGLAVGVGFGAIGKSKLATFAKARNLALGIGIQNFPEGLAVSLPLRGSGMSVWRSFWYGQLSGMVEPIAGILGAFAVILAEPLLPYTLAFAAGAMIYVVVDDIIPEAQTSGNGKLASTGAIIGFVVMMSLDVGLG